MVQQKLSSYRFVSDPMLIQVNLLTYSQRMTSEFTSANTKGRSYNILQFPVLMAATGAGPQQKISKIWLNW